MKGLERADRLIAQAGSAAWPGPRAWNMVGDDCGVSGRPSLPRETPLIPARHLSQASNALVLFLGYYVNNT
jgi:hypothetical protein